MKKTYRLLWESLFVLFWGNLTLFFINSGRFMGIIGLGMVLGMYFKSISNLRLSDRVWLLALGLSSLMTALFKTWLIQNVMGTLFILWGIIMIVTMIIYRIQTKSSKSLTTIGVILGLLLTSSATLLLFIDINPSKFVTILREKAFPVENVKNAKYSTTKFSDGTQVAYNLQYDSQYPNGFLDIYHSAAKQHKMTTVIFVHGGGYVWGDKQSGDPNTGNGIGNNSYLKRLLKSGYNVAELNYALAPQYKYPIATKQVNQALTYLTKNAQKLGLNMKSIVIGGGSAGGNLAGQLVELATNHTYAHELHLKSAVKPKQIKAVIFASALLDNTRYGETHSAEIDYLFYQLGRVYFGQNDLHQSKLANQSNVIRYVNKQFPPTYISDGNTGTFYDQAFDLSQKLSELGIYHQLDYHSKSDVTLTHGYQENNSPRARQSMDKMLKFLQRSGVR